MELFRKLFGRKKEARSEKDRHTNELTIPAFLIYPKDPLSERMFENKMKWIQNKDCGYRFMLFTDVADPDPDREEQVSPFMLNENHYYYKTGSLSWYCICTMKDALVANTPVRNWFEKEDQLTVMFGASDMFLRTPQTMRGKAYKKVSIVDLGEYPDFNMQHGFDETHVYGHIFYLGDQLYKKFIC